VIPPPTRSNKRPGAAFSRHFRYYQDMRINADFSQQAMAIAATQTWIHSPESGVDRIMLDRIGDEVARATSIVRYAPGSRFPQHEHAKGEEFLVLDGVFSDEHGHYPTGFYVRNPPGSGHAPFSKEGCRILVKLRQFDVADLQPVVVDTGAPDQWQTDKSAKTRRLHLHEFGTEKVCMLRLPEGCEYSTSVGAGGMELLVVSGAIFFQGETLTDESWLRLPAGFGLQFKVNSAAMLWVKSGHLPVA
jgi:anti-sigma factor ChrR (cupin superfamily)